MIIIEERSQSAEELRCRTDTTISLHDLQSYVREMKLNEDGFNVEFNVSFMNILTFRISIYLYNRDLQGMS